MSFFIMYMNCQVDKQKFYFCSLQHTVGYYKTAVVLQTLLLPSPAEPSTAGVQLLSPSLLLGSQSLKDLLSVPSALSVLHRLALKCILSGRLVIFFLWKLKSRPAKKAKTPNLLFDGN